MIDYFALALTHGLIVIAVLRIIARPELDREEWDFTDEAVAPAREPAPREAKKARRARGPKGGRDA